MSDKPRAEKLGWCLMESRRPFENHVSTLREDRVEIPQKGEMNYAYLERAEAVIIVPVTKAGEILLIRQYRYPVDEWCMEVPAGGSHDTGEASLEEVAKKELSEEIGATSDQLEYVTFFYSANSLSDEKCHVYLALDVEFTGNKQAEASEVMETRIVPASEAMKMARSGEMKTGPCALAVLLCEVSLREKGFLR
jgi:ADP-ribose pyrophosphatase